MDVEVGQPLVALEGVDEVGDLDLATRRPVRVPLGHLAEGLLRPYGVVVEPGVDAGTDLIGGRAVEAVLAVAEGVLEDEPEVAVVPDVEGVGEEVLVVREEDDVRLGQAVADVDPAPLRVPPAQAEVGRAVEEVGVGEPRPVLQLPLVVGGEVAGVLARPEPGGVGDRVVGVAPLLVFGQEVVEAVEGRLLLGRHELEGRLERAVGGVHVAGAVVGEAEVEPRLGVFREVGVHPLQHLQGRLVLALEGVDLHHGVVDGAAAGVALERRLQVADGAVVGALGAGGEVLERHPLLLQRLQVEPVG